MERFVFALENPARSSNVSLRVSVDGERPTPSIHVWSIAVELQEASCQSRMSTHPYRSRVLRLDLCCWHHVSCFVPKRSRMEENVPFSHDAERLVGEMEISLHDSSPRLQVNPLLTAAAKRQHLLMLPKQSLLLFLDPVDRRPRWASDWRLVFKCRCDSTD